MAEEKDSRIQLHVVKNGSKKKKKTKEAQEKKLPIVVDIVDRLTEKNFLLKIGGLNGRIIDIGKECLQLGRERELSIDKIQQLDGQYRAFCQMRDQKYGFKNRVKIDLETGECFQVLGDQ